MEMQEYLPGKITSVAYKNINEGFIRKHPSAITVVEVETKHGKTKLAYRGRQFFTVGQSVSVLYKWGKGLLKRRNEVSIVHLENCLLD